jgi:ribokinase
VEDEGEAFSLPAEKVQLVSSHGAGDAFIGTLCAALLQAKSLHEAAKAASHAAALHVSAQD